MKTQNNGGLIGKFAKNTQKQLVKPYNMAILSENSAEINLYGDVVMETPRNWGGEKIDGLYIAVDEFLKDLEEIKEKDNITVHINSGGGDLYAGLAIYNRLKQCKGTVTTINDGLAASAASLIFQAGDVRKMNVGSNLMAHGVSGFLFGYYNTDDLKSLLVQFEAHNKAIINVYAEAMGVDFEEAKDFVDGETWLTGEEAVEKGLADEIITSEEEGIPQKNIMQRAIKNAGSMMFTQFPGMETAKEAIAVAAAPKAIEILEEGGTEDLNITNIAELRNAFPDFVSEIENAAKEVGKAEERARIQSIEAIENNIADKALINSAKYGDTMTAEQLAFKALQAQAQVQANVLNDLTADTKESGVEEVTAAMNSGIEEPAQVDVEAEAKQIVDVFNKLKGGRK